MRIKEIEIVHTQVVPSQNLLMRGNMQIETLEKTEKSIC